MDYEKLYNELKEQHETLTTTFETFQETSKKEKEELENKYTKLETESLTKINELQQANVNLFLQIPKEPQPNQTPTPQEEKTTTCDDIIKNLGGDL